MKTIAYARVSTRGYVVDYVRPGALSIPGHFLYFPDHVEPFPPADWEDWLTFALNLLLFVPVGFLIVWARRPSIPPVLATLLAAALVVPLAAGRLLFHGRHIAVAEVVMQTAGALLGALLAWWWARHHAASGGETKRRDDCRLSFGRSALSRGGSPQALRCCGRGCGRRGDAERPSGLARL